MKLFNFEWWAVYGEQLVLLSLDFSLNLANITWKMCPSLVPEHNFF